MFDDEIYPVDSQLARADVDKTYRNNQPGIVKLAAQYVAARFFRTSSDVTGKSLADQAEMPSPQVMQNLRTLQNNG